MNPDQLVVAKDSQEVVDRKVADKELMTIRHRAGHGSVEAPVPDELRGIQSLADEHVRELCTIGQRIEDHYGFPQDIEWGWAGGRFAILQAREITGANLDFSRGLELWKTPAALATMYDERWVWSRAYSDEVQTGPSTPSFYTYLQLGMTRLKVAALNMTGTSSYLEYTPDSFTDFPFFRWYGARAYYNLAFERERIRRFIPPFARDEATLWPFPAEEREEIRDMSFDWDEFLALLRHLHTTAPDVSLLGTTAVIYEGLQRWTDAEEAFWRRFDLDHATVEEIFAAQLASREGSRFGENVVLPFTIYLFMLPQALRTLCAAWLDDGDGELCNRLMGGLQTKTSEENIAVWRLSRAVKASPRLAELVRSKPNTEVLAELDRDDAGRRLLGRARGVRRRLWPPGRGRARRLSPAVAPRSGPGARRHPSDDPPRGRGLARGPRAPAARTDARDQSGVCRAPARCAAGRRPHRRARMVGGAAPDVRTSGRRPRRRVRLVRRCRPGLRLLPRLRALLQRQDDVPFAAISTRRSRGG